MEYLKYFLNKKNTILGFYGGGNYGDEFLMEILQNLFSKNQIHGNFMYLDYVPFNENHKTLPLQTWTKFNLLGIIKSFFKTDNIIFGGGGMFSEDSNIKHIALLLIILFFKIFFNKDVYYIGLGFYNKNNKYKEIFKKLVLLTANKIFVRDKTSFDILNSEKTFLSKDISDVLIYNDFSKNYTEEIKILNNEGKEKTIKELNDIIIFSIRKTKEDFVKEFLLLIEKQIKKNPNKNFIFWEMWCEDFNLYGDLINNLKKYNNFFILPLQNSLNIFYGLKKYKDNIKFISPQFHGIITAKMIGTKFLPLYYAQKGSDILEEFGIKEKIYYKELNDSILEKFI